MLRDRIQSGRRAGDGGADEAVGRGYSNQVAVGSRVPLHMESTSMYVYIYIFLHTHIITQFFI